MITIPEFYSNRDILITGATGFVGKVLIEKLLRSCSSIGRVFCLLREKRSKSINERLDEIKSTPVSYLRNSHAVCWLQSKSFERLWQWKAAMCRMEVDFFCETVNRVFLHALDKGRLVMDSDWQALLRKCLNGIAKWNQYWKKKMHWSTKAARCSALACSLQELLTYKIFFKEFSGYILSNKKFLCASVKWIAMVVDFNNKLKC